MPLLLHSSSSSQASTCHAALLVGMLGNWLETEIFIADMVLAVGVSVSLHIMHVASKGRVREGGGGGGH